MRFYHIAFSHHVNDTWTNKFFLGNGAGGQVKLNKICLLFFLVRSCVLYLRLLVVTFCSSFFLLSLCSDTLILSSENEFRKILKLLLRDGPQRLPQRLDPLSVHSPIPFAPVEIAKLLFRSPRARIPLFTALHQSRACRRDETTETARRRESRDGKKVARAHESRDYYAAFSSYI